MLIIGYIFVCFIITYYALKRFRYIYILKRKYNIGFCESDIIPEGANLRKLLIFAFFGGWISGALGLGGGSIFNPVLISMNMAPSASSATGKYMIMFSKLASVLVYFIYGLLNW